MKTTFYTLMLSLIPIVGFSQLNLLKNKQAVLGIQMSTSMVDNDGIVLTNYSFQPGYNINDRVFVSANLGYLKNLNRTDATGYKLRSITGSISCGARILRPIHRFSPMIGLTVGNMFYTNVAQHGKPGFIKDGDVDVLGTFNHFLGFAKMRYLMDIKFNNMNVYLGPTYSIYISQLFDAHRSTYVLPLHGYGLEVGVTHRFNINSVKK